MSKKNEMRIPLGKVMLFSMIVGGMCLAVSIPSSHGRGNEKTLNILRFESNDPAQWERMGRVSDSLPLTLDEIERMVKADIASSTVMEMVRTRRVLALASADALIGLKKAGANDDLIAAISAYALPPNTSLNLMLNIDVASHISDPRGAMPYFYVEFHHRERGIQEHLLFGSLGAILGRKWRSDTIVDTSDPLLPRRVRRIRTWGSIPLSHAGEVEVRVFLSHRPDLTRLDDLSPKEMERVDTFVIDYPAVSLRSECNLEIVITKDPVVVSGFTTARNRLFCRWD